MKKKDGTRKTVKAYINGLSWQHEMTPDVCDYSYAYTNIKEARLCDSTLDESGLVEVEIKFKKWVIPQRIGK